VEGERREIRGGFEWGTGFWGVVERGLGSFGM